MGTGAGRAAGLYGTPEEGVNADLLLKVDAGVEDLSGTDLSKGLIRTVL